MSEASRGNLGVWLFVVAVVIIGVFIFLDFGRADPPTAAPAPPAPAPTTTTASECETRQAWLSDDASRYGDAMDAAVAGRIELSDALRDYVRDYGRALDLWLRIEADTEALLQDCWDALPADDVDRLRDFLAADRERWRLLRSHCRAGRELFKSIDRPNPWVILGVPC